jgi:hypothetical protein
MQEKDDPILPDGLVEDLSALYRTQVRVPTEVDRAVTSGARAHFARRSRWIGWASAAAAVAAAVVVSVVLLRNDSVLTQVAVDAYQKDGDADGNATVDIRDALALARRVEAGNVTWTRWDDVNRDKVIDRKDVDAIAMIAVSVNTEVLR